MVANRTKWLLAGPMWLTVWPGVSHAQSPDLMNAFNRCSGLYSQGRYAAAEPLYRRPLTIRDRSLGLRRSVSGRMGR